MRVTVWKELEVEIEADVKLSDCINEWLEMSDDESPRRKLWALDGATRVLERFTPEMVAEHLENVPEVAEFLRNRLQKWMERLGPPKCESCGCRHFPGANTLCKR